jgi:hypothetical protein
VTKRGSQREGMGSWGGPRVRHGRDEHRHGDGVRVREIRRVRKKRHLTHVVFLVGLKRRLLFFRWIDNTSHPVFSC